MIKQIKTLRVVLVLLIAPFLQSCMGVAVVGAAAGMAFGVAAIVAVVNLATDQYPNVDFEKPAAVEIIYTDSYDTTWNEVIDTLYELTEQIQVSDKSSGVIRTSRSDLNDVTWVNKALGKATFTYEYNIVVRRNSGGTSVKVAAPFWSEKIWIAEKQKNIPEGSNTVRHIFFNVLRPKLNAKTVLLPDRPDQDIRRTPLNRISWSAYEDSTYIDASKNKNQSVTNSKSSNRPKLSNYPKYIVKEVQIQLNKQIYNAGKADGLYGGNTRKAVEQFQKDNNINATGELDDETLNLLGIDPDLIASEPSNKNPVKEETKAVANQEDGSPNPVGDQVNSQIRNATTKISNVSVYAEQDAFSEINAVLSKGKSVSVLESSGDWSLIRSGDIEGYVYTDDLQF